MHLLSSSLSPKHRKKSLYGLNYKQLADAYGDMVLLVIDLIERDAVKHHWKNKIDALLAPMVEREQALRDSLPPDELKEYLTKFEPAEQIVIETFHHAQQIAPMIWHDDLVEHATRFTEIEQRILANAAQLIGDNNEQTTTTTRHFDIETFNPAELA